MAYRFVSYYIAAVYALVKALEWLALGMIGLMVVKIAKRAIGRIKRRQRHGRGR